MRGKFVRLRYKVWRENVLASRKKDKKPVAAVVNTIDNPLLKGNRIIDLETLATEMRCSNSCDLPLSFRYLQKEVPHVVCSVFSVNCFKCGDVFYINSSAKTNGLFNNNYKVALGKITVSF